MRTLTCFALIASIAMTAGCAAEPSATESDDFAIEPSVGEIVFVMGDTTIRIDSYASGSRPSFEGRVRNGSFEVGTFFCTLVGRASKPHARLLACGDQRRSDTELFELEMDGTGVPNLVQTGPMSGQFAMYRALGFDGSRQPKTLALAGRRGADALAVHQLVSQSLATASFETARGRAQVDGWVLGRDARLSPRLRIADSSGGTACDLLVRSREGEPSVWASFTVVDGTLGELRSVSTMARNIEVFFELQVAKSC